MECGTGPAGLDGQNAYTVTTANFVQPNVGANVTVNVSALGQSSGLWGQTGQVIFIEGGGYYEVVSATTTTMVVENLGYTGNAAPAATVSFPAGVSPAGLQGPSVTGPAGANGANGTTQLVTLYSATAVTATTFTPLHTVQNLPSSGGSPLFATVGDVLRVHLSALCTIQFASPPSSNHWAYELEIVMDGTSLILPIPIVGRNYSPFNGITGYIDIIAWTVSPLLLIVDISNLIQGFGFFSGTTGYLIIPGPSNMPFTAGNPFAAGRTSGVDQSADVSFQINGRRTAVGTPGGSPSLYLPELKIELLKK